MILQCPGCPVVLQPLSDATMWPHKAIAYAEQHRAPIPTHGPAAVIFLALVAHAMVCHPLADLNIYLEAYLSS